MRSHHSKHRRPPEPAPRPPGTNPALIDRLLEGTDAVYADSCGDDVTWCSICGQWIPITHTILEPGGPNPPGFVLCWVCGCAMLGSTGRLSEDPHDWPPPIGSPRKLLARAQLPASGSTAIPPGP